MALDYVQIERSEIRGDRRIRPRRPVRPAGQHDRRDRGQARGAGHRGVAFLRPLQRGASCGPSCGGSSAGSRTRASPPSSPANRAETDLDPARPGRIRQRLRHLPGPPGVRPDRHAPPAGRQVPRLGPRHQRVPDDDRRAWPERAADQFAGAELPRLTAARRHRHPATGRDAGRERLLPRAAACWSPARRARARRSLAAAFADGVCRRGGRCLYFAFEESPAQIVRNMASIGFDLKPYVRKGLLRFQAVAPDAVTGWKSHLAQPP